MDNNAGAPVKGAPAFAFQGAAAPGAPPAHALETGTPAPLRDAGAWTSSSLGETAAQTAATEPPCDSEGGAAGFTSSVPCIIRLRYGETTSSTTPAMPVPTVM